MFNKKPKNDNEPILVKLNEDKKLITKTKEGKKIDVIFNKSTDSNQSVDIPKAYRKGHSIFYTPKK